MVESKIINLLKKDSSISQRQIAIKIGETYDSVRYHMAAMLKKGLITKVGNNRNTRWIIN